MEKERVTEQLAPHAGMIDVRSDENKREIYETAIISSEDVTGAFSRNLQSREELKLYQKDLKSQFGYEVESSRNSTKDSWTSFNEKREQNK